MMASKTRQNCLKQPGASRLESTHGVKRDLFHSDAAWRWIVVLGSHLCHQLVWGMIRSTGVLLVQWKLYFDTGAAVVSSVASVMSASLLLTGPVAGFLCKRYGCRPVTILGGVLSAVGILLGSQAKSILHLCISVGGITGSGFSLAYTASAVIPGHYFDKHFAIANGISCAGTGVGVMIIPPIVQTLIQHYGWRGSMMVMSAILANVCVCGAVFRPPFSSDKVARANPVSQNNHINNSATNEERTEVEGNLTDEKQPNGDNVGIDADMSKLQSEDDSTTQEQPKQCNCITTVFMWLFKATGLHLFWKSYRFLIVCLTQMLVGLSFSGIMVHIVYHIRLVCTGVSDVEASLIISLVGIGSLLARATHGILVDKNYLKPITGYTIGIVVGSLAVLISPAIKEYHWFAVFGAILGICMGLNMSLLRVLVKDYLELKDLAQGIGLSAVVFFGSGDLIGPLLSGWLYDTTGNYNISFFVMGGLLFTAGPVMLLVPVLKRFDLKYITRKNQENRHMEDDKV